METQQEVNNRSFRPQRAYLFLILIWAVIYLFGLGGIELKSEEGRRVLPAQTMFQDGDWLVPHIGGKPYFGKPPFINWMIAASFRLCGGQSEFAARLPSAIFILVFISILFWQKSPFLDFRQRYLAALFFLTSIGIVEKGRTIEIEAMYVCQAGLAIVWWLNGLRSHNYSIVAWLGSGLMLACGMLTKGPAILLFFYAIVLAVLIRTRRFREIISPGHFLSLLVWLGLGALWYCAVRQQGHAEGVASNMGSELMSRMYVFRIDLPRLGETSLRSVFYFVPWIVFLPLLWNKSAIAEIPSEHKPVFLGIRDGFVYSFLIIILMPNSEPRYSLPAVVPAFILAAYLLVRNEKLFTLEHIWRGVLWGGFLLLIPAGVAVVYKTRTVLSVAVLLLCAVVAIMTVRKIKLVNGLFAVAQSVALLIALFIMLYAVVGPVLSENPGKKARDVIHSVISENNPVCIYDPGYQAFVFYLRRPVKYILTPDRITSDVKYMVVSQSKWETLSAEESIARRNPQQAGQFNYRDGGLFYLIHFADSQ